MKPITYAYGGRSTYPPSILLITSNPAHGSKLKHRLEKKGYRVYQSDISSDGLAVAHQNYFELIVFDGKTPDLAGNEAFNRLFNDPEIAEAPKVMLTTDKLDKAPVPSRSEIKGPIYWLSGEDSLVEAKLGQIIEETHYLVNRYL
ncbi:MAG: hypothetical protein R3264_00495 [Anaerolineae bacterium]|nr:hypothetical protein [Anaerolineae bacterium]